MPELRVSEQHAGEEGAERGRQAHRGHQPREADGGEQRGSGEDLVRTALQRKLEHQRQQGAAEQHHADDRRQCWPANCLRLRVANGGGTEHTHQRQHRDHAQVLKQQHREGFATVRAVHLAALGERRQCERGGSHRQCNADNEGARRTQIGPPRQRSQRGTAHQQVQRADAKNRAPQRPQPLTLQLQTDDEHQQRDAELGGVQDRLRLVHHADHRRPDHHAGEQITEHRAEAQLLEQWHQQHCGSEQRGRRSKRRHAMYSVSDVMRSPWLLHR